MLGHGSCVNRVPGSSVNAARQMCALSGPAVTGRVSYVNLTLGTSCFSSVGSGGRGKLWFGFSSEASYLSYM